ncbi:sensor histidine kinase [Variovorax sp. PvP013]|uniref:sensor histidine kinase n=1 Tax=Variovorax sp. PvP013 TaxID=3156435 RepID=UPI003D24E247
MRSLRGQLVFFWLLLLGVCAALAVVMVTLYRSSVGVQIATGSAVAERACREIATRYARSLPAPLPARPQLDLLQVLLQLVLLEAPQVEGGVWQVADGLVAYAYPTYEGGGAKRDIPAAEQPLIVETARQAARTRQARTDVVRGSREALIVTACPLAATGDDLAAWTMTRTHAGALDAQASVRAGLVALMAAVIVSGLWLGLILRRGLRHVQRLEASLARAEGDVVPVLEATGVRELDRIVDGFNRYRLRFEEARATLREAARQRSRDQRLAALGRMTGGIAHEIRNPIAAMRLKAENALAGTPARQPDALRAIVGQIDRLEGLVQSLLGLVQPLVLAPRAVALPAWLDERAAAVEARATAAGVEVVVRHDGPATAVFDPMHVARAVDNLLDNAVRHTPRGGRVVLAASRDDAAATGPAPAPLRLRVDDTGAGVDEALQSQLFEPFATGRADGTGLGLALAREVALAHGGDLRHIALDPGTRFELEIPWRAS